MASILPRKHRTIVNMIKADDQKGVRKICDTPFLAIGHLPSAVGLDRLNLY